MLVLGIETSCDECSIALVRDGKEIVSNVIATQIDLHRRFDGVVPEIASRLHPEWIISVYKQALEEAAEQPIARAAHVLAREFGWTPQQIGELTLGQILLHLQMLREGVERHTDAARQPRPVPPLRGDYRQ